jgi:5'(3')-deoxyribonucleotidase
MISNQPPMQGALTYLPDLWKKTYSVLATYGINDTYNEKSKWLQKYFPFIDIDRELIFVKKKYLIDGDILVDDNASNCKKWLERHPNGIAVMLAYPYNIESEHIARLFRVDNWLHLNSVIEMFINFAKSCQTYVTDSTQEDS